MQKTRYRLLTPARLYDPAQPALSLALLDVVAPVKLLFTLTERKRDFDKSAVVKVCLKRD